MPTRNMAFKTIDILLLLGVVASVSCKELENSHVTSTVSKLVDTVARLEDTVTKLQADNVELQEKVTDLETRVSTARSDLGIVAFCVTLAEEDSNEYYESETIRYRIVKTNYGDTFDASTYMFTAPVKGIYMFYTNQLTDYESAGSLALFRFSAGTEYMETRSWSRTEINVMSNMVIIECQEGDQVYVKQYYSGTTRLHTLYGGIYNTFSGYLITILP